MIKLTQSRSCNARKSNKTSLFFRQLVAGHKYIFPHVKCVRVLDGDSAIVDIDLGFYIWMKGVRLRFARINAPELKIIKGIDERKRGQKAKTFLKNLIEGKPIIIETIKMPKDRQPHDSFGRYLVEVYDLDGNNINDLLVDKKLAVYKDY